MKKSPGPRARFCSAFEQLESRNLLAFTHVFLGGENLVFTGTAGVDHLTKIYAAGGVVKYDQRDAGGGTVTTTTTVDPTAVKTVTIQCGGGSDVVDLSTSFVGIARLDELQVSGEAGNDTLTAPPDGEVQQPYKSTLDGGDDDDFLYGGTDWDQLVGGSGIDWISGGEGADIIDGGPGADTLLFGGNGYDHIEGGPGNDVIRGGSGDDYLFGDGDDDNIDGQDDSDHIYGGAGDDTLKGSGASDWIYGGIGADTFDGGTQGDYTYSNEVVDQPDQPYAGVGGQPGTPDMRGSGGADCDFEDGYWDPDPGCELLVGIPTAQDDEYYVVVDTLLIVEAPGVLQNDTDPDEDPLAALFPSAPEHGDIQLSGNGGFTYTPDEGFIGEDAFTYRVFDGTVLGNVATVTITVGNSSPVGAGDQYVTAVDTELVLGVPGVLINDDDPDGQELTAELVTDVVHGQLTFNSDGSFTYQPDQGFEGEDFFTYKVFDGYDYSDDVVVSILVGDGGGSSGGEGEGGGAAALFFQVPAGQATSDSVELAAAEPADSGSAAPMQMGPTASSPAMVGSRQSRGPAFDAPSDQQRGPLADRKAIRAVLTVLARPVAILNDSGPAKTAQRTDAPTDRKLLSESVPGEDARDWLFAALGDEPLP